MYRVELKDGASYRGWPAHKVPNVPCGVESLHQAEGSLAPFVVPNVPCGVERPQPQACPPLYKAVPNVPCGVERSPITEIKNENI